MGHPQYDYFLDVECYSNYFVIAINSDTGATRDFELYEGKEFDSKTVTSIHYAKHTTLGFNSSNYDLPVIVAALRGDTNAQIKTTQAMILSQAVL